MAHWWLLQQKFKKATTYGWKSPSNDWRSQMSLRRHVVLAEDFLSKTRHFWFRTVSNTVTLNLSAVTG